jgi:hypothetical protein
MCIIFCSVILQAQPLFRDPKKYPDMADPLLNKQFPEKDLNQAVAIVAMCLQEEPEARPLIGDVVTALSFLSTVPTEPIPPPLHPAATSDSKRSVATESEYESETGSESEGESDVSSQHQKRVSSKKSSRKSGTRSRNKTISKDSADESASSSGKSSKKWQSFVGNISQKTNSSIKSSIRELSQKSSKKSSSKEKSQKNSRKSSKRGLSQKGSGKSSARVSSCVESEDESMISSHRTASSSQYTSSCMSDRSSSRGSGSIRSDINGSRRLEESMRLDRESDDDRISSSE